MAWRWGLACIVALCSLASASMAQTAPTAEMYGRLPAVGEAAISPDGRHLAVFRGEGDAGTVSIHRIDADGFPTLRTLNAPAGGSIRGVSFVDDRYALITISQTFDPSEAERGGGNRGRVRSSAIRRGATSRADATDAFEFFRQISVDLNNGQMAFMLSNARFGLYRSSLGSVAGPIEGDAGSGRLMSFDVDGQTMALYRINLSNGVGSIIERGTENTWRFCMDPTGAPYARLDYDEDNHRWAIFSLDGRAREVMSGTVADTEEWRIPELACRIAGRPRDVVAIAMYAENGDRMIAQELNLTTGARAPLFANDLYDVFMVRDPYSRDVIGYGWTSADADQFEFLDPQLAEIDQRLTQLFRGSPFTVVDWDRARTRFVISSDTLRNGPSTFLYERESGRMRLVGHAYPALTGTEIPQRVAIRYRARDGVMIPAYLTLPPGREARGLPRVVMPHGGPHAANVRGFDWWSGYMAARGYAVLEPDFRGSTGYGRAWEEAGHGGWGNGVMQNDVTDGVQALIRNGTADSARVCIVGASYGGYAALAGAAFTPELYACAVSVAGVSDMRRMFRRELSVTGADSPTVRFWRESMGAENLDRDSPANAVDAIRAPVLLIHGAHDTVVPFDQSTYMDQRMRAAGKDVRLIELQGDDHWLSDASTRTQMLSEIDAFLAAHIGNTR